MRMLKKIGIFAILIAFISFIGFRFVEVKAEGEIQMVPGASIRVKIPPIDPEDLGILQGLKYSATFDATFLANLGASDIRGFFIMYGVAGVAD